jgi:hypothetical protein
METSLSICQGCSQQDYKLSPVLIVATQSFTVTRKVEITSIEMDDLSLIEDPHTAQAARVSWDQRMNNVQNVEKRLNSLNGSDRC